MIYEMHQKFWKTPAKVHVPIMVFKNNHHYQAEHTKSTLTQENRGIKKLQFNLNIREKKRSTTY